MKEIITQVESLRNEIKTLRKDEASTPNTSKGPHQSPSPALSEEADDFSVVQREIATEMHAEAADMHAEEQESEKKMSMSSPEDERRPKIIIPAPAVNGPAPEFKVPDFISKNAPTYATMPMDQIRALTKERELTVDGHDKAQMVQALREDDRKTPSVRARDRAARKKPSTAGASNTKRTQRPRRRSSDGCLHTPREENDPAADYSSTPIKQRPPLLPIQGPEVLSNGIDEDSPDELTPMSTPRGDIAGHGDMMPAPASINWN